jgi:hypothetical protein
MIRLKCTIEGCLNVLDGPIARIERDGWSRFAVVNSKLSQ